MFLFSFYSPYTKGWVHLRSIEDGLGAVQRAFAKLPVGHKYQFISVKEIPLNYESKRYLR